MAGFDNDLADFEAKVDQNIKLLASKKVESRRAAVLWLGESGEPHVIEHLVKLYQREKDPSVKNALVYALGKFRALQQALDSGQDDKVLMLLKRVTTEGKLGKRLGIPTRTLMMVMLGLVISLVVLVVGVFATGGLSFGGGDGEIVDVTEVADAGNSDVLPLSQLKSEITALIGRTRDNLTTLQAQYQAAVDGTFSDSNCIAFFNELTPYALSSADSAAYSGLSAIVDRLNAAIDSFTAAKSVLDTACLAATPALTAQDASAPLQTIATAQSDLVTLELDMSEVQDSAAATEVATEASSETQTEEPPTATPVPGADPSAHFAPLSSLIDDMTTVRGPAVLLSTYWSDVQSSGTTGGCGQPDPEIPDDYTIPDEAAAASPALRQTVDAVNLGLQLLREGWRDFRTACDTSALSSGLARGQIAVSAINAAFDSARNQLNALRNG
ncbi:MAG: HEAT repeat domain-containing protein [Anaerolineae bacterium]